MFKLRLISAIVLVPAVVFGILYLPYKVIAILSAVIFALAAWEWIQMTVFNKSWIRFLLLAMLVAVSACLLTINLEVSWIYWCALIWWSAVFVGVCYYPVGAQIWRELLVQPFIALLMFVPAWLAFNSMLVEYLHGRIWVLFGCCLIWSADIGAYIFGKLWGKDKLLPVVSPGKTWVGMYGGIFCGLLLALVFYTHYRPHVPLLHLLGVSLFTLVFAVIGDLVESMLKRVYGFKDSGSFIPGHGGMYDRLDSLLAAFPIYYLGLSNLFSLQIIAV